MTLDTVDAVLGGLFNGMFITFLLGLPVLGDMIISIGLIVYFLPSVFIKHNNIAFVLMVIFSVPLLILRMIVYSWIYHFATSFIGDNGERTEGRVSRLNLKSLRGRTLFKRGE